MHPPPTDSTNPASSGGGKGRRTESKRRRRRNDTLISRKTTKETPLALHNEFPLFYFLDQTIHKITLRLYITLLYSQTTTPPHYTNHQTHFTSTKNVCRQRQEHQLPDEREGGQGLLFLLVSFHRKYSLVCKYNLFACIYMLRIC